MPVPQPPVGSASRATLQTCPDCGGILEPTTPPWQSLVQSLHAVPAGTQPHGDHPGQWECLICGYRKRD